MQDRYFSDEELVAYLDGEADYAPIADIDAALKTDPALEARVDALRFNEVVLMEAFDGLTPDKPFVPLTLDRPAKPRRAVWSAITGAAMAASLAVGFFLGAAQQQPLNGWAEYVAAYQALYSNSTLAHIDISAADQQAELDRVAASIGKSISVDQLSMFPDVTYTRAQILSFEGQALIQLAFLTATGEPVALCIIRSDDAADAKPAVQQMEGLSAAIWAQNGYDYIIIGGTDDALIQRLSATFSGINI